VEGLLREIVKDLDADQAGRKIENEATWSGIEQLLNNLREVLGDDAKEDSRDEVGEQPMPGFTIILDDPAGNSFIEFVGGMADPKWNMRSYDRTRQDDIELGLVAEHEDGGDNDEEETPDENIFVFPGSCSSCHHPIETRMKKVTIPHFKVCLLSLSRLCVCIDIRARTS
jgi:zinc finger protein